MRIKNLTVRNFRAIRRVEMADLGDMIMIAGPNGCGKSCILDAIRLLKSIYGGYAPNEWQQWFSEFQIDFQRNPKQMITLLRDRARASTIEVTMQLDPGEVAYIKGKARSLLEDVVWKVLVPGINDPWVRARGGLASELRAHKPAVDQRTAELLPVFLEQLDKDTHEGRLEISPLGEARTKDNILLEILFASYEPKKIGLIDYHGSHRNYNREQLGGINLNLDSDEERLRQHVLYNYGNKYANIKSEMAADFVRRALLAHAGQSPETDKESLADTLKELFTIFFPGKSFDGPNATSDGGLEFPVKLAGGGQHDINELSSGEKEVLFGYLRLRNSAPQYSVILLDEPELHLNPALVRGLPQFYYRHLGVQLRNQIWLVTHSDAFLRESVGTPGIAVYHMQYSPSEADQDNQIRQVKANEEVEAAILGLVGDLAAYRPGAKVVFFEGADSDFDLKMVSRLFSEVEKTMNFVSGGNRSRVERLHRILEESVKAGGIPLKIYSIVDKDSGPDTEHKEFKRHFTWDVYHIENYLLEPKYILDILRQLSLTTPTLSDEGAIEAELRNIARNQINSLVGHLLREVSSRQIVEEINLNPNLESEDLAAEMRRVIEKSVEKVQQRVKDSLAVESLRKIADEQREILEKSLNSDDWKRHFRGRDVLRVFAGRYCTGMRYEQFRNLIVNSMTNANFQPEGMKRVINAITQD